MFYIFHGEEEFGKTEELARLRGQLAGGDPAMAELNTTVFDGTKLKLDELRHACDTMPFMADRRLVIVHGLLGWLASGGKGKGQEAPQSEEPAWKRAFLKDLAAYLPCLPPTTRLFFIETKELPASHPILKIAVAEGEKQRGFVKLFKQPKEWDLPDWIRGRVQAKEGDISHEAVNFLAALVGSDLRLLDQEIDKLLLYVDGRQVNTEDVRTLVSRARETSIFDLVDCVARRQTDRALKLLHGLLDDSEAPLYILTMLARQVRILIQIRELGEQALTEQEIAKRLKLHPFVVKKGMPQAQNFTLTQLETAHRYVVETDWSIKTGQIGEVLALDTLVVNLTQI